MNDPKFDIDSSNPDGIPVVHMQIGKKTMYNGFQSQFNNDDYTPDSYYQQQNNNIPLHNQNQERKNNIINLIWFTNLDSSSLDSNIVRADLCTVSFNADFGNIRIDFFRKKDDSLFRNVAFLDKFDRLAYGTLYPGSMIRFLYSKEESYKYACMEQLIYFTDEPWQYNRPVVYIKKVNNDRVEIIVDYYENDEISRIVQFTFIDWQVDGLKQCFKFALEGGFLASANALVNKNQTNTKGL